jgi:hypothetical protein
MKKQMRKLVLAKETVRNLEELDLEGQKIAGGYSANYTYCCSVATFRCSEQISCTCYYV